MKKRNSIIAIKNTNKRAFHLTKAVLFILSFYFQNLSAQSFQDKPSSISLSLTTNPILISENSTPNIGISITNEWIGFTIDGSYYAKTGRDHEFSTQYQKITLMPAIRVYPFNSFFNKLHKSVFDGRHTNTSCPVFNANEDNVDTPNGIYISLGYGMENRKYNYIPDSSLNSPLSIIPFGIKNNSAIAEAGYQITIRHLSIGLGYQILLSFPQVKGNANPFGNSIYTNVYPFKYMLQTKLNLQIGLHLIL